MAIFFWAGSWSRSGGTGATCRRIRKAVIAAGLLAGAAVHAAPVTFEQALLLAEQRSAALTARQAAADRKSVV